MFSRQQKYLTKLLLVVGVFVFGFIPIISLAYDVTPGDTQPGPVQTLPDPYNPPNPNDSGAYNTNNAAGTTNTNGVKTSALGGGARGESGAGIPANQTSNTVRDTSAINLGNPVYNMLFAFVVTFFGWLLSWGTYILNIGITDFMLGFGDKYFNWNIGVAVEAVWKIVRDLFNLTFIFGLVYIGFKMILDADDSTARKSLVNLIGAALLVNFSLFIVKFVIDLSHITAAVIANGITGGGKDIGNAFINVIGLGTIFAVSSTQIESFQNNGGALAYIFGTMIFLAIAAFVFAAGGILLIIRFVVLNIYLVFSPIMFLGWVFPSMNSHSSKYWDGFLKQAFFAPAYLMMLYLSLKVLETYRIKVTDPIYANVFASGASDKASGVIPFFILAMAFMILSLVVAKNMGAVGAGTAVSIMNKVSGGAQKALSNTAWGASGLAYRNTGGRLSKGAMNLMDRTGASNWVGGRSVRNALKGGYEYGAGGTSLAKTRSNIEAHEADVTKNRVRMNSAIGAERRSGDFRAQTAALANNTATVNQLDTAMNGLAATIRNMSDDERSELNFNELTNHHVAGNLTDAHIAALEKTGKFDIDQINAIRTHRTQSQTNVAQHGFATVSTVGGVIGASNTAVRTGGISDAHQITQRRRLVAGGDAAVGNLPVAALLAPDMMPYLTPRVIQARMVNGLNDGDRIRLRNAINAVRPAPGTPAYAGNQWTQWETGQNNYGAEFFR